MEDKKDSFETLDNYLINLYENEEQMMIIINLHAYMD